MNDQNKNKPNETNDPSRYVVYGQQLSPDPDVGPELNMEDDLKSRNPSYESVAKHASHMKSDTRVKSDYLISKDHQIKEKIASEGLQYASAVHEDSNVGDSIPSTSSETGIKESNSTPKAQHPSRSVPRKRKDASPQNNDVEVKKKELELRQASAIDPKVIERFINIVDQSLKTPDCSQYDEDIMIMRPFEESWESRKGRQRVQPLNSSTPCIVRSGAPDVIEGEIKTRDFSLKTSDPLQYDHDITVKRHSDERRERRKEQKLQQQKLQQQPQQQQQQHQQQQPPTPSAYMRRERRKEQKLQQQENQEQPLHSSTRPGAVHIDPSQGFSRENSVRLVRMSVRNVGMSIQHSSTRIFAYLVESNDLVESRRNHQHEVVIAEEMLEARKICGIPRKRFLGLLFLIINIVIGYTFFHLLFIRRKSSSSIAPSITPTSAPTTASSPKFQIFDQPVMQSVKDRGFLRCRATTSEVSKGKGLTLDLCTAIAAAIFDDPVDAFDRVEFVGIPFGEQFGGLWNGTIDVSSALTTFNMKRDVFEPKTGLPMSFSTPYFYSGMVFGGVPEFVDCADRLDTLVGICRSLSVCVQEDTTHAGRLDSLLPGITVQGNLTRSSDVYKAFVSGKCNVFAIELLYWTSSKATIDELGYSGEYGIGTKIHSFEPLAYVTKGDDSEWSDFCNWILQALITAEAYNITQEIALSSSLWSSSVELLIDIFPETTSIFGDDHKNMFRNAIAAVGNYGELFERNLESLVARGGSGRTNTINNGDTGLLYPEPFGVLTIDDAILSSSTNDKRKPNPIEGGTLESILVRGKLRCGIIGNETIFASLQESSVNGDGQNNVKWFGMDIEYCRAIASAIFQGPFEVEHQDDNIIFVEVGDSVQDGYISLTNNEIDVLVGGSISLTSDVNELTTGKGYTFTHPYFYYDDGIITGFDSMDSISSSIGRSLVTRETDKQWSSFVRWIVTAIVYAEGQGITQLDALDMPVVELYGEMFIQMFRDTILMVGNYDEIFTRTITEPYNIIRTGRNRFNFDGGPQFVPLPLI